MAQLKKYGIFDAVRQYMAEHTKMEKGGFTKDDITGSFVHRGEAKRRAYRDGRARGWGK